MKTNKYLYKGDCRFLNGDKINDMKDQSKDITWKTFIQYVEVREVRELFPHYDFFGKGLHIKDDPYVSFSKSFYDGKPCYFITWSGIEYVWTEFGWN